MDNQDSRRNQRGQQRRWAAHVAAFRNSGLSRAEYCRRQNLSYHALTYWCRKFTNKSKPATTLVPVGFKQETTTSEAGIGKVRSSELTIMLPGNITVAVGDHFSPATLHRLLAVLGYRG